MLDVTNNGVNDNMWTINIQVSCMVNTWNKIFV